MAAAMKREEMLPWEIIFMIIEGVPTLGCLMTLRLTCKAIDGYIVTEGFVRWLRGKGLSRESPVLRLPVNISSAEVYFLARRSEGEIFHPRNHISR
jgi:hypothetical protein